MTGRDLIDFIERNGLEDAKVSVTSTIYYSGDHECRTTMNVDVSESSEWVCDKLEPTINLYVDDSLY